MVREEETSNHGQTRLMYVYLFCLKFVLCPMLEIRSICDVKQFALLNCLCYYNFVDGLN
jgi:hypothetical protein